jgi:hypothetical protein
MIPNRLALFFCCLFLNPALFPAAYSQPSASSQPSAGPRPSASSQPSAGPRLSADSSFYHTALLNFSETYHKEMGAASRLYTGSEYLGNGQRAKGSPFFLSDSPLPGSVVYQGEAYDNLDLQYDLLSGEVLIKDYTQSYNIELTKEKVTRFTIAHHEFWYLTPGGRTSDQPSVPDQPSTSGQPASDHSPAPDRSIPLDPGYYERLNSSAPFLYARREKKIAFPANAEEQAYYRLSSSWFLQLGDRFYRVESKGDLLNILKDKKDPLKKFIRESHINFKKDFEQASIKTIAYYAQIRN